MGQNISTQSLAQPNFQARPSTKSTRLGSSLIWAVYLGYGLVDLPTSRVENLSNYCFLLFMIMNFLTSGLCKCSLTTLAARKSTSSSQEKLGRLFVLSTRAAMFSATFAITPSFMNGQKWLSSWLMAAIFCLRAPSTSLRLQQAHDIRLAASKPRNMPSWPGPSTPINHPTRDSLYCILAIASRGASLIKCETSPAPRSLWAVAGTAVPCRWAWSKAYRYKLSWDKFAGMYSSSELGLLRVPARLQQENSSAYNFAAIIINHLLIICKTNQRDPQKQQTPGDHFLKTMCFSQKSHSSLKYLGFSQLLGTHFCYTLDPDVTLTQYPTGPASIHCPIPTTSRLSLPSWRSRFLRLLGLFLSTSGSLLG